MTNEPPRGLKNNLLNCLGIDVIQDENFFGEVKSKEIKRLTYSLCFFHSIVQERKGFGALGFNNPYEFTESDLRISLRQIKVFNEKYIDEFPREALEYLIGECNYGGRVTDDKDRRLLLVLVQDFINETIYQKEQYTFFKDSSYHYQIPPSHESISEFLLYVNQIPNETNPEIIGFNKNAAISKNFNEFDILIKSLVSCKG